MALDHASKWNAISTIDALDCSGGEGENDFNIKYGIPNSHCYIERPPEGEAYWNARHIIQLRVATRRSLAASCDPKFVTVSKMDQKCRWTKLSSLVALSSQNHLAGQHDGFTFRVPPQGFRILKFSLG